METTYDDRQLLELAAGSVNYKFSDIEFANEHGLQIIYPNKLSNWNPLLTDKDASYLEIHLGFIVEFYNVYRVSKFINGQYIELAFNQDRKRAITIAAAIYQEWKLKNE